MPRRKYPPQVVDYMRTNKSYIATTRFNNETWQENQRFLDGLRDTDVSAKRMQCLYSCSVAIGEIVPIAANVLVLEMNNETNQLLGIGLIKNHAPLFQKYTMYSQEKYNRYSYYGAHHITRADMDDEELELLRLLERYCFHGRRHQKRMDGIRLFPPDILYEIYEQKERNLSVEIANMFKRRALNPSPTTH